MIRMDQDPAVKRVRWQAEIDVQLVSIDTAIKRIRTSVAEIKRLKGIALANGATADDLGTFDFFTAKTKTDLMTETNKI